MIAFNYGTGIPSYGWPSATQQAMTAYQNYASQAYGIGGLDQLSMVNPYYASQSGFYDQILASQRNARAGMAQQAGLRNLPPNWETMPLDQFLAWAQGQAAQTQTGRQQPNNQNGRTNPSSPLNVHAHAYTNSSGEEVPVAYVRVSEAGKYNTRQRTDNVAGWNEFDTSYSRGQLGSYYTVTVVWQDGRQMQTSVKNQGYAVDIW